MTKADADTKPDDKPDDTKPDDEPDDKPKADAPVTHAQLDAKLDGFLDRVRGLLDGSDDADDDKPDDKPDDTAGPRSTRSEEADVERAVREAMSKITAETERDGKIKELEKKVAEVAPRRVGRLAKAIWGGDD